MKPPMPYFGGKQRIAKQIVDTFPPHLHYVEPFAGGLSVLLAKEPSKMETVNDLDHHLVTFWRVLRSRPEELIMQCTFTPHSRSELAAARDIGDDLDELEIARRVWVQLAMGRSGRRRRTGWRFYIDASASGSGMAGYLAGYTQRIPPAAARLAQVALECRPALDVIADYGAEETSLLYVDPPYLGETRESGLNYVHEMADEKSHRELAEALTACRAQVVLSGYASPLYRSLYRDWETVKIKATTEQANKIGSNSRVEVLWCNFAQDHLFTQGSVDCYPSVAESIQ